MIKIAVSPISAAPNIGSDIQPSEISPSVPNTMEARVARLELEIAILKGGFANEHEFGNAFGACRGNGRKCSCFRRSNRKRGNRKRGSPY
jgi:hypothetical protein